MPEDDARLLKGAEFHADLLADVERHIAEAERRIDRQAELARRLDGRAAALARELLRTMERSLELMWEHQRLLLRLLGRDVPEE